MCSKNKTRLLMLCLSLLAMPGLALAHDGLHSGSGWLAGLIHPFTGADHWLAMLAVGYWSVQQTNLRPYAVSLQFTLAMCLGASLGAAFGVVHLTEYLIAASVLCGGLVMAMAVRVPVMAGVLAISVFGAAHGYAHGAELVPGMSLLAYAAGFTLASCLLQALGAALFLAIKRLASAGKLRFAGWGIVAYGIYLLGMGG